MAALKAFNATPEQLEDVREQFRKRRAAEGFGIWPENWRAWELFVACGDQWTVDIPPLGGKAHYQGIDTLRLDSIERRLPPAPGTEVPPPRVLFHQLQLLVREARDALNGA